MESKLRSAGGTVVSSAARAACAGLVLAVVFASRRAEALPPAGLANPPAPSARAVVPPGQTKEPVPLPPYSNEMRAELLFRSGEQKFDSGLFVEACADFAQSLKLGPKLGTLLNLALCHETVGKLASAWSEFHHAAAWAAQNNQRDRHEFAQEHIVALESRLPRIVLHLPADGALANVEMDGEPLPEARWYMPLYLDPGEHSVAVSAPGKRRSTVTFRVIESPTEQFVVVPPLSDEAPAMQVSGGGAAKKTDPDATRRTVGWGTLGVAAAGVAVGATFAVLAVSARSNADAHCSGDVCDAEGVQALRDAQSRSTLSAVGFGVGVAAAAVGGYLVLTSRPSGPSARVGVATRGDGAELGIRGAF